MFQDIELFAFVNFSTYGYGTGISGCFKGIRRTTPTSTFGGGTKAVPGISFMYLTYYISKIKNEQIIIHENNANSNHQTKKASLTLGIINKTVLKIRNYER
ncbi:unnamed protein product [Schistosoma margrebowiei]|uniref:Uncharacterized protein n=1 Tax=Schistosoma margrebowiei TaxID=48269 RepID=A0A183MA39_9TREM|nr:unnamed protein product [Schistosoma margrebowiei]